MAVLGYCYIPDVAGITHEPLELAAVPLYSTPGVAPVMAFNYNAGGMTENWYRRYSRDSADNGAYKTNSGNGDIPTNYSVMGCEIPAGTTELWFRQIDNTWGTATRTYGNGTIIRFYNYDGTKWTRLSELVSSNNNVIFNVYDDTGTNVVKAHSVTTASNLKRDSSNGDVIVDYRFVFDSTAGYVQQYDYSATRCGESLGKTMNTLPITHAIVDLHPSTNIWTGYSQQIARIVANEPTFGMYVMPIYAKAEGTHQDQLSGNYNRFKMGRKDIDNVNGVVLQKPTTGNVRYSFKPNNLTEQGLPANYNVLSMKWIAALDGITPDANQPTPSIFLKHIPSATFYDSAAIKMKANINYAASSTPQNRSVTWDKNPYTGQNWTPTDLSDFEVGFKL